jgi:hypothetical protein
MNYVRDLALLQGLKLATAALPQPVANVSFQPADLSCLLTVADASENSSSSSSNGKAGTSCVHLWRLDKLWDRHELQTKPLQLPADCVASCHAWAPEVGPSSSCRATDSAPLGSLLAATGSWQQMQLYIASAPAAGQLICVIAACRAFT